MILLKLLKNKRILSFWSQWKFMLMAVLLGKLLTMIWKIVISDFGPAALGTVEVALTIFLTAQSFSLIGMQSGIIRFVARTSKKNAPSGNRYLLHALKISLTLSILIISGLSIFPNLLNLLFSESSYAVQHISKYLFVVPVLVISELLWAYMAGIGAVRVYAVYKYIFPGLFRLCTLILLGYLFPKASLLVLHIFIASCVTLIVTWLFFHFFSKWKTDKTITPKETREFMSYITPMSGSFLLYVIYGAIDIWVISKYLGLTSAGLLSVALAIVEIPNIALSPMLNIFQTQLAPFIKSPRYGYVFTLHNSYVFLIVGIILSTIIYTTSPYIVPILFGSQFDLVIPLIGWLLVSKLIEMSVVLPLRHLLDFYGQTRTTFIVMLCVTVIKLLAGIYFVPHIGLNGLIIASWTSMGSHAFLVLSACIYTFRIATIKALR